jgi:hypothetical protein
MNKGIIIIWPKYNHFKNTIISELQINNYNIIKEHSFNVNKNYIKNFLSEIHYGKEWWSKNLIPEVEKRLNADTIQNLHYLIVEKSDIYLIFKKFKKDLREKYKIDKSYFHLCDPDCYKHLGLNCNCATEPNEFKKEFNNHIHMLTNKNSIHFLTNSTYNTEYKFYKFFDIYVNILKNNNLDINNFCVDNGGILAAYGIRDTHDLDYLTTTNILINNQYISCENKNHKVEYEKLGYNINDLINNDDNYFYHFGIKFMSLEILKKFKYNRTHTIGTGHKEIRKKDICDYNLINKLL